MASSQQVADVCLLLEGTYPFVTGGVSAWTHELITAQSDLTFHLISMTPPVGNLQLKYKVPKNVISIDVLPVQTMRKGTDSLTPNQKTRLFAELEIPLYNLLTAGRLEDFEMVLNIFKTYPNLGSRVLLNSQESWRMLLRMYHTSMGDHCFLDYFWSWRSLLGSLYSLMFANIPPAHCYHSLCTGYAGLLLARVKLETGQPCVLTEHGIYTNERRIEIILSDWLHDQKAMNLTVDKDVFHKDLKDFWIESFMSYSKICYQAADSIITLYEGNKDLQIADGAQLEKLHVIPNGVNYSLFTSLPRDTNHPPTVALIGRVVPIKDVKTYIRSVQDLRNSIPNVRALVVGPTEEDPDYYAECVDMVKRLGLEETLVFTGKVDIRNFLPQIDVMVLTSISEAQPLTLLEAGAAGIPSVATNVGSCEEILYGRSDELATEPLGQGGIICPLASPKKISEAVYQLLTDTAFHNKCGAVMQERVRKYYDKDLLDKTYHDIYLQTMRASKYPRTQPLKSIA